MSLARRTVGSVWSRYASDQVGRPKFSDAYNETRQNSLYQPRHQDVTQQAADIQAALSDPEVAKKVFEDPASKVHAIQAIHHQDQHLPPPPAPEPAPGPTRLDVLVFLGNAREAIRQAFRLDVSLSLAGDEEILSDLADVELEAERFRKYHTGMSLDEAIEKIMEGI